MSEFFGSRSMIRCAASTCSQGCAFLRIEMSAGINFASSLDNACRASSDVLRSLLRDFAISLRISAGLGGCCATVGERLEITSSVSKTTNELERFMRRLTRKKYSEELSCKLRLKFSALQYWSDSWNMAGKSMVERLS